MPKQQGLLCSLFLFVLLLGALWLLLYPLSRVGQCPGQFVLYAALNQDESQIMVVTLPRSPFS